MMQSGFFDLIDRYAKLDELGDPLTKINAVVDWRSFRPLLKKVRKKPRKSNAGRPPFDELLMFKTLLLQSLYNLSDTISKNTLYFVGIVKMVSSLPQRSFDRHDAVRIF